MSVATMLIFTCFNGAIFADAHRKASSNPPMEENPIEYAAASPTPSPTPTATPTPTPTTSPTLMSDAMSYGRMMAVEQCQISEDEILAMVEEAAIKAQLSEYYTEDDIVMMAQLIHAEANSVYPLNRRAAVAWTVCNRIDCNYSSSATTISAVITQPGQYAWYSGCSYTDVEYAIAEDVLMRWATEQITGEVDEGRVLPSCYIYFWGDGSQNHFHDGSGNYWDYSVEYDPYEDWA